MSSVLVFDSWPEAFDTCRERNRPIHVAVKGKIQKIYPSGSGLDIGFYLDHSDLRARFKTVTDYREARS